MWRKTQFSKPALCKLQGCTSLRPWTPETNLYRSHIFLRYVSWCGLRLAACFRKIRVEDQICNPVLRGWIFRYGPHDALMKSWDLKVQKTQKKNPTGIVGFRKGSISCISFVNITFLDLIFSNLITSFLEVKPALPSNFFMLFPDTFRFKNTPKRVWEMIIDYWL